MNKRRLIFLAVFGAHHLCAFMLSAYMDANSENLSVLFKIFNKIIVFKYGALLGLILFAIEFLWVWFENKEFEKQRQAALHEHNLLKAKVYDLTETLKSTNVDKNKTDIDNNENRL